MTTFQYVKPTDEQVALMQTYRDLYASLYGEVSKLPSSRGLSLAMTKLEESAMWLNKSLTNND